MSEPLLEVRHLSKTFPGLKALDDVSLDVTTGELIALVGQNGSGKSTLVKTLAGIHQPDPGGEMILREDAGHKTSLHFIHQDLGLVGQLSTVENLDLGRRLSPKALLPSPVRAERRRAEQLIASFGGHFDVNVPIDKISAAERTLVAIARAFGNWDHPRNVLVLDEPTAALHGEEVEKLFTAVRTVAAHGAGVVFISHRLDEVIELADRVVVLRDGRLVANAERGGYSHDDLVTLITGQALSTSAASVRVAAEPVMRVRGLRGPTIAELSMDVRAGEVLGISGVLGSGREEVAQILFGAAPGETDRLEVAGAVLPSLDPRRAIAAGVAYVPGDRHRQGIVPTMSAGENITLPRLKPLQRWLGYLDHGAEKRDVNGWVERVGLRPAQPERSIVLFSGGNQQKVVLAKWLRNQPKVLLLDEPTQGVDVGAKASIYELIAEAAAAGAGVLVCSSDEKELATICDRVLVMRYGYQVADIPRSELSEAALVHAALDGGESVPGRGDAATRIESEVVPNV